MVKCKDDLQRSKLLKNCKMVAIKKFSRQKQKNVKGRRTLHDILHVAKKHEGGGHFMTYNMTSYCAERHVFNTLLCCSKFTHSCWVSERRRKKARQVMLWLVLLIKFVVLLIIFQISFSFNLLVAKWRLLPESWSPKVFFTRHDD